MALFRKTRPAPAPRPATLPPSTGDVDSAIRAIGGELLDRARAHQAGVLSAAFWSDKLMDWAMKDETFKVQLFRFVDALPRLTTPEMVHEHLVDYLGRDGVQLPPGMGMAIKAGGVFKGAAAKTITGRIAAMAEKFIAGEDAASARSVLEKLWKDGMASSLDLLGEACLSADEAETYRSRYAALIDELPTIMSGWPANERLESDHLGAIPRANVSIKITALHPRVEPPATDRVNDELVEVLRPLLEAAGRNNVLINFDMEQYELKDLTLELFMRCCEECDFTAGLAMQAYLRSGDEDAQRVIDWSKRTGRQVTVRLVKGAYWDFETINAELMGWPVPVWSRKRDSDASFERMARRFLASTPHDAGEGGVKLALGSHNARSIAFTLATAESMGLPRSAVELQMLHGMADQLKAAVIEMGLRLREYVPVGAMIPGMAYLVRRLLENTSNESWLRAGFAEDASIDALLASPHDAVGEDPGLAQLERLAERHALTPAVPGIGDGRPFRNEPRRDFASRAVREAFAEAIATPARSHAATVTADAALSSCVTAPAGERAAALPRAAARLRQQRDAIAGVVIRATGRTWREADAEVCAAIDDLEYAARAGAAICAPAGRGRFVGERTTVLREPLGVVLVVADRTAPLSGPAAHVGAALATGNAVLVASDAPACTGLLIQALAAELPDGSIAMIDTVQADVAAARAARVVRPPAPLGGAIIIDASADLDAAVTGVQASAFALGGRAASAAKQVVVLEAMHDVFVERLCAATRELRVGDPLDPATDLAPVRDGALDRALEDASRRGRAALELSAAEGIGPHIFVDLPTDAALRSGFIAGPVLSMVRSTRFDEALEVVGTRPLAAVSVYTRKPSHVERCTDVRAAVTAINRPTSSGAVGRQSVIDVASYVTSRVVVENTMRRGFAPELTD